MKRVVVTGMGIVNALGCGIDENWRRILNAECGVREITGFDVSDIPAKIAARVDHSEGAFNPDDWVSPKDQRRMDNFIIYGIAAAQQAVEDSGWQPEDEESQCRTGVLVGSGIGGLSEIAEGSVKVEAGNVRKLSPFFIPASLINLISGHISIRYGFKGPNHAVVTACATGTHAIGDAARMIMLDDATPENGCMQMVKGSYKLGLRDHMQDGIFTGGCQDEALWSDPDKVSLITPKAGGISIHHCLSLHGSEVNQSGKPRRGIVYQYRAADAYQLADNIWEDTGLVMCGQYKEQARCEAGVFRLPKRHREPPFGSVWNQDGELAQKRDYFG